MNIHTQFNRKGTKTNEKLAQIFGVICARTVTTYG